MAETKETKEAKEQGKEVPKKSAPAGASAHERKEKEIHQKATTSIMRIAGKDINGELGIQRALGQIKGIGSNMSHALSAAIEQKLNIPRNTRMSTLSEQQVEAIEEVIKNPGDYGIPIYLLNRNKDMETGKNIHIVSNDLIFATRQDINRDVTMQVWRGYRHQYGQKVRGQHTRTKGRTGRTIGVMKKSSMPGKPAPGGGNAPAGEAKKEEKPKSASGAK